MNRLQSCFLEPFGPQLASSDRSSPALSRTCHHGWQPDHVPVKDRSKEAFLSHVFEAFRHAPAVDAERLTRAVLKVLAVHVSTGEMDDIRAIIPDSLHELFPKRGVHR
ncbi:DUF2267 domain-containing protein [Stieleria sp. ICT_E10.1]|uniref:DUF2267 domain-containing protein n=1 Tax=Stieleria sedimenti TaxID=2976331 RepID=UPI0021808A89|nr:DUF2267 domain-containing protein [Stieleria sedimenti]MCS7467909.1 DUF2267 domain-containing protein [Stieleria sedimenti]